MYEFEALLFADSEVLAEATMPVCQPGTAKSLKESFDQILKEAGEPEKIDDNPNTAPSKRIKKLVPGYRKTQFGPIITKRIGLQTLRNKCPNFNRWVTRLETIR